MNRQDLIKIYKKQFYLNWKKKFVTCKNEFLSLHVKELSNSATLYLQIKKSQFWSSTLRKIYFPFL